MTERLPHSTRQNGSASVEYTVLTVVVVTALFVPVPGLGESVIDTLVTALRQFQANTTYLYSYP